MERKRKMIFDALGFVTVLNVTRMTLLMTHVDIGAFLLIHVDISALLTAHILAPTPTLTLIFTFAHAYAVIP